MGCVHGAHFNAPVGVIQVLKEAHTEDGQIAAFAALPKQDSFKIAVTGGGGPDRIVTVDLTKATLRSDVSESTRNR